MIIPKTIKLPRKKKKAYKAIQNKRNKGWVLYYDRDTLPYGWKMKDAIKGNAVFYDSSKGATAPRLIHLGGNKNKHLQSIKIIDISNGTSKNN
jgi:hypothetical protein